MSTNSNVIRLMSSKEQYWKDKIVSQTSGLVYKNCNRYKKFSNYEDLLQEGFIGLIKAINSFDPKRFSNFISYADRWVMHYVKRAASRYDIVYDPRRHRVVYAEINESDFLLEDMPDNIFAEQERKELLNNAIKKLSYRESSVVRQSFGIDSKTKTLEEIGAQFGISYERVRQIKVNAIKKLKKSLLSYEDFRC